MSDKIKETGEIVATRVKEISDGEALPAVQSPMEMISMAIQRGAGEKELAIIERMFEFDLKVKAQAAKEAFYKAVAQFKLEAPDVIMDKINKQTGNSPYSSTGNFLRTVNPALATHGLSANFRIDDTTNEKLITVACVLTHELGFSDQSSMSAEPDTLGPKGTPTKTMIHGRMSTLTHLMRATFSAVTGMFAIDKVHDDDGNAAGGEFEEKLNDQQYSDIVTLLQEIGKSEQAFCKYKKVESLNDLPASKFEAIVKELEGWRK